MLGVGRRYPSAMCSGTAIARRQPRYTAPAYVPRNHNNSVCQIIRVVCLALPANLKHAATAGVRCDALDSSVGRRTALSKRHTLQWHDASRIPLPAYVPQHQHTRCGPDCASPTANLKHAAMAGMRCDSLDSSAGRRTALFKRHTPQCHDASRSIHSRPSRKTSEQCIPDGYGPDC